jgi:hypothetical protein
MTEAVVDVLRVQARGVRSSSGISLAVLGGRSPEVAVDDASGEPLLRVHKRPLDEWFARRPTGEAILRIDRSLNRFHTVTYADGRTGRFDSGPRFGVWELMDGGKLLVHARTLGAGWPGQFDWECAQDGSLSLLDFLATVITYREVLRLRHEHVNAIGSLS